MKILLFHIDNIPVGICIYATDGSVAFEYHAVPIVETGNITSVEMVASPETILTELIRIFGNKTL